MSDKNLILLSPSPFSSTKDRTVIFAERGERLDQVLQGSGVSREIFENALVTLNGFPFDPKILWTSRLKQGVVMQVQLVPKGGDGKNPLGVIAAIALTVMAPQVGLAAATSVNASLMASSIPSLLTTGMFNAISAVASTLFLTAGSFLLNSLFPASTGETNNNVDQDERFLISGSSNQKTPWYPFIKVYGKIKVFPRIVGDYTISVGEDSYYYALFDFGYSDLNLTEFKIGEEDLSEYDDVTYNIHYSTTDGSEFEFYTNDVYQDSYEKQITKEDGSFTITTQTECDEIGLDIYFPSGLFQIDDEGNTASLSVTLTIEYRKRGDVTWLGAPAIGSDIFASSAATLTSQVDGDRFVTYQLDEAPSGMVSITLAMPGSTPTGTSLDQIEYIIYSKDSTAVDWVRQGSLVLTSNSSVDGTDNSSGTFSFSPTANTVTDVKIENSNIVQTRNYFIYQDEWNGENLSPSSVAVPTPIFSYEYNTSVDGTLTIEDNVSSSWIKSIGWVTGESAQYEIQITRVSDDWDSDSQNFGDTYVSALRTITYTAPINFETPHVVVEFKIKASDQISGSLSEFSALCTALLPIYDPNTQTWSTATETRNPAWAALDILRGTANGYPIADSRIDLDSFAEWAAYCDQEEPQGVYLPPEEYREDGVVEKYHTFDAIIEGGTVVENLQKACAAGRARYVIVDGKHSVIWDKEQTVPRQLFTPENTWGFSSSIVYTEEVQAVRASYINEDDDYNPAELVVYNDGFDDTNTTNFIELEFYGITRAADVWRKARVAMATLIGRREKYSFETDIQNLRVTQGDLIWYTHDVAQVGGSPSLVKAVVLDSGLVVGLELEKTLSFSGNDQLVWRSSDGTISTLTITQKTGDSSTVEFPVGLVEASAPAADDLVVLGQANSETISLLVESVKLSSDLSARIVCVDYAPGVYTADTGEIPPYDAQITPTKSSIPPKVQGLQIRFGPNYETGAFKVCAFLSWTLPSNIVADHFDVYVRNASGRFTYHGQTKKNLYTLPDPVLGAELTVKVIGRNASNQGIGIRNAAAATKSFMPPVPDTPAAFVLTPSIRGDQGVFTWTPSTGPFVASYQIRWYPETTGATWETAQTLVESIQHPTNTYAGNLSTGTFLLKAVDRFGQFSTTAITTVYTLPTGLNLNFVASLSAPTEWLTFGDVLAWGDIVTFGDMGAHWDVTLSNTVVTDEIIYLETSGGSFVSQGFATFDNYIDLGDVYLSKLRFSGTFSTQDNGTWGTFGPMGDWTTWGSPNSGKQRLYVEYAYTSDDPAGTPTWSDWIVLVPGGVEARAFKFRLVLETDSGTISPAVSGITIVVDMPDVIQSETNISCPAGGLGVTYSKAFHAVPALNVTPQSGAEGDTFKITNASTTGFDVRVYNSGSGVSRSISYIARGY